MKSLLFAFIVVISTPALALASAYTTARFLPDIDQLSSMFMDVASTSGGIHVSSYTSASSSSRASASVVNIVTSGSDGGTVHTSVRTESNGVVHEESMDEPITPGVGIDITIGTSSGNSSVRSTVHVGKASTVSSSSIPLEAYATSTAATSSRTVPWLLPFQNAGFLHFLSDFFAGFKFW